MHDSSVANICWPPDLCGVNILLTWELPSSAAAVMLMWAASIKEMLTRKGFWNKSGTHEDKPNQVDQEMDFPRNCTEQARLPTPLDTTMSFFLLIDPI